MDDALRAGAGVVSPLRLPLRLPRWVRRLRGDGDPAVRPEVTHAAPAPRGVDIRVTARLFAQVRAHVEDFTRGEEAGFLLCSLSALDTSDVLLAREWRPVPQSELRRNAHGSVLSWSSRFNSEIVERAIAIDAAPVLVHSHGEPCPTFSSDDRKNERALLGAVSRLTMPLPAGTVLLGDEAAAGSFWRAGANDLALRRIEVLGETIDTWPSLSPDVSDRVRARLTRQTAAIGPRSDAKLTRARVAVIGVSGGGSHIVQQLAHQGVGTLMPVDDQLVEESNLGRMVGAQLSDVGVTPKTAVAYRLAQVLDPDIDVIEVRERFPSTTAIEVLRTADVIVSCVDSFRAREAVNAFCRRYLIPLIDVGMAIRSNEERLARADGQVITSLPGQPCLRCWFLTDALLEHERRKRPPGYDEDPDALGEPQVVSMNGVLASEACNCVLDLLTGYSGGQRGAKVWQYNGRTGEVVTSALPPARADCPACAEEGLGDPQHHV
jgi:molybdopterin/thiamine biosynthesis adenylyltransferase